MKEMVMDASCKHLASLKEWVQSSSTGEEPHCAAPIGVALQGWGTSAPCAWTQSQGSAIAQSAHLAGIGLGWKKLPPVHAMKE